MTCLRRPIFATSSAVTPQKRPPRSRSTLTFTVGLIEFLPRIPGPRSVGHLCQFGPELVGVLAAIAEVRPRLTATFDGGRRAEAHHAADDNPLGSNEKAHIWQFLGAISDASRSFKSSMPTPGAAFELPPAARLPRSRKLPEINGIDGVIGRPWVPTKT